MNSRKIYTLLPILLCGITCFAQYDFDKTVSISGNLQVGSNAAENSEGWSKYLNVFGNGNSKISTSTSNVISGIWSHDYGFYNAPAGGIAGTFTPHPFSIITNKTSQVTVDINGNLGIGTTTPSYKLDIKGTGPNTGIHLLRSDVLASWFIHSGRLGNGEFSIGDDSQYRLVIGKQGNVGIGITNPTERLEVNGYTKSGIVSIGGDNSTESSKNYINLSTDNNGSLLLSSNLYLKGTYLFVANQHTSMSGSAIKIPGNQQSRQNYIEFWTNSVKTVNKDEAYAQSFPRMVIDTDGNVGIATVNPTNKLDVNGTIRAKEVKVTLDGWSDFVFKPDYRLRPLTEVEQFINTNGHLPEIPTEKEVTQSGVGLGEMNAKLLQKVEELTLYMIKMSKENEALRKEMEVLKAKK